MRKVLILTQKDPFWTLPLKPCGWILLSTGRKFTMPSLMKRMMTPSFFFLAFFAFPETLLHLCYEPTHLQDSPHVGLHP